MSITIFLDSFQKILMKYRERFNWNDEKILKIKENFEKQDKILVGAYEVFINFFDEDAELEFADTVNRFIKIK